MIVSTGEQVTVGLRRARDPRGGRQGALASSATSARSSPTARSRARASTTIDEPADQRTRSTAGEIAVIAGFQGVDEEGNITTLGRGGSDTTGVAIAAALKADVCEIYTDVDGVYTADPNVVPTARKVDRISYEEMLELASLGAKVLQIRSVEFGMKYGVPIHVRSSFSDVEGTWVVPEETAMEKVVVSGVTASRDEAKITLRGSARQARASPAQVFAPLADASISVDMIVQNQAYDGTTDLTFTVPEGRPQARASRSSRTRCPSSSARTASGSRSTTRSVKVSVVGVGMRSHAGVATKMFELLAEEGINIQLISTSEIKISCVIAREVRRARGARAARRLRTVAAEVRAAVEPVEVDAWAAARTARASLAAIIARAR